MQPCGNQCFEHERHGKCLQSLPSTFVERSFRLGWQNGALTRLRYRLACSSAQPSVKVVVAGGSVTAGPGGNGWSKFMFRELRSDPSSRVVFPVENGTRLASNGVGPAYLSACWDHHFKAKGARTPDIAFLEYGVNDLPGGQNAASMEALVRKLVISDTVVVILHHFAPTFMSGASGYKGIYNATAERKHSRVARHYGVSSVSVGEAVGLSPLSMAWRFATGDAQAQTRLAVKRRSMNTTDALSMWHACSFFCHFQGDLIHPTKCFQEQMGRLAAHAVRQLISTGDTACTLRSRLQRRGEPRGCAPLPKPIWGREQSRRGCGVTSLCWSNVGPPESWNLKPFRNQGYKLLDLKRTGRGVPGQGNVFKMLWEGRAPGSFVEFKLPCSSSDFRHIRVMYLTGHAIGYGYGRIEINNQLMAIQDAFRPSQGSLFSHADFAIPTVCGDRRCPTDLHLVRITVVNQTSNRKPDPRKKFGFGVNSLMCMP